MRDTLRSWVRAVQRRVRGDGGPRRLPSARVRFEQRAHAARRRPWVLVGTAVAILTLMGGLGWVVWASPVLVVDEVVVTDVYAAREDPLPGVTGALVADAVRGVRAGVQVEFVPALGDVVPALTGLVAPGDLVLTVGAGDITSIGPALLLALGARSIREGQ